MRLHDPHEAVALYLADALGSHDRSSFEQHLASCSRCRADVARLSRPAAVRAFQTEPVDPPPELRERVLFAAAHVGGFHHRRLLVAARRGLGGRRRE
jgi:anti-sigma factor RsiW